MYSRTVKTLTVLVALLGVGEIVSALIIWREHYADAEPVLALLFCVPFFACALLLRFGKVMVGTVLSMLLCVFEVVNFPGWTRHGATDWISQVTFTLVAIAALVTSVAVIVTRRRGDAAAVTGGPVR